MSGIVERLKFRAASYRAGGPSSEHTAMMLDEAASTITALEERVRVLEANLAEAYERAARVLEARAQEFRRQRDPGLANQAQSYANAIRALTSPCAPAPAPSPSQGEHQS